MKSAMIAHAAVCLLLCAFSDTARADARVFFTQMTVNDCNEVGTCDWKLSCGLGNQQETEFFSMSEANTNESVTINRTLTQREFPPVTVNCTVMEHDGGIGAEWEQVGSGSVIVSTTGNHLIRLNQHRDEGDVTVSFTVENIGSTGQPLTIAGGSAIHSGAGKCLDVHAPDQYNNGARVQVWDCNNTLQQTWRFENGTIRSGVRRISTTTARACRCGTATTPCSSAGPNRGAPFAAAPVCAWTCMRRISSRTGRVCRSGPATTPSSRHGLGPAGAYTGYVAREADPNPFGLAGLSFSPGLRPPSPRLRGEGDAGGASAGLFLLHGERVLACSEFALVRTRTVWPKKPGFRRLTIAAFDLRASWSTT
jgi:hypothetical protein